MSSRRLREGSEEGLSSISDELEYLNISVRYIKRTSSNSGSSATGVHHKKKCNRQVYLN